MNSGIQKICVIGMGFVGLTLSVVLAECGHEVLGIEINMNTVDRLNSGSAHFFEKGLNSRLSKVISNKTLKISGDISECRDCRFFIITVGTPLDTEGSPRSDMVERAAKQVASVMKDESVVILRSTVKLGTTRHNVLPILEETGKKFHLAFCPERTIEGNALEELRTLPQICGGLTCEDSWSAAQLFQSLTPTTIRVSSLEAAELLKLLDNSYRDLFFAFGNEVAQICDAVSLSADEVIKAGNLGYPRTNIAKPGLVGGPCLGKDPHILIDGLKNYNYTPKLIEYSRRLNEQLPGYVVKKLSPCLQRFSHPLKIAICGMAFKGKPETDDLRGSPSKLVINEFKSAFPGATVVVQDFACTKADLESFSGCKAVDIAEAFRDAHLVIIANNNAKYESLDIDPLFKSMIREGVFYDLWNVVNVDRITNVKDVKCYSYGAFVNREVVY